MGTPHLAKNDIAESSARVHESFDGLFCQNARLQFLMRLPQQLAVSGWCPQRFSQEHRKSTHKWPRCTPVRRRECLFYKVRVTADAHFYGRKVACRAFRNPPGTVFRREKKALFLASHAGACLFIIVAVNGGPGRPM